MVKKKKKKKKKMEMDVHLIISLRTLEQKQENFQTRQVALKTPSSL